MRWSLPSALRDVFALDDTAYRAMAARARQFAEYMFSPQSVAVATRAVYMSLLARDGITDHVLSENRSHFLGTMR